MAVKDLRCHSNGWEHAKTSFHSLPPEGGKGHNYPSIGLLNAPLDLSFAEASAIQSLLAPMAAAGGQNGADGTGGVGERNGAMAQVGSVAALAGSPEGKSNECKLVT